MSSMELKEIEVKELTEQQTKEITTYMGSVGGGLNKIQGEQFFALCREFGLNPFKREIYAVKYGSTFNIIVGYEVYIKRANLTGMLDGWKVGTEGQIPNMTAWVEIHRKDWKMPLRVEVEYSEYVGTKYDNDTGENKPNAMWASKPKTMLKKVAVAQGFRMAFPVAFSGMPYISDELPKENESTGIPHTTIDSVKVNPIIADAVEALDPHEQINLKDKVIVEALSKVPPVMKGEPVDPGPTEPPPEESKGIKMAPAPEPSQKMTTAQQKKKNFWSMLKDLHGGAEGAEDRLEALTTFKGKEGNMIPGKRSMERMSDKQLGFLFKKIQTEHNALKKK